MLKKIVFLWFSFFQTAYCGIIDPSQKRNTWCNAKQLLLSKAVFTPKGMKTYEDCIEQIFQHLFRKRLGWNYSHHRHHFPAFLPVAEVPLERLWMAAAWRGLKLTETHRNSSLNTQTPNIQHLERPLKSKYFVIPTSLRGVLCDVSATTRLFQTESLGLYSLSTSCMIDTIQLLCVSLTEEPNYCGWCIPPDPSYKECINLKKQSSECKNFIM